MKQRRPYLPALDYFAGWTGAFTTHQAAGAMPNGTRISKVAAEDKDIHPVGTRGTVLGSLRDEQVGTLYFVEWDPAPKVAVAVVDWKIARLQ